MTSVSDIAVNKLLCYIDSALTDCSITGSQVTIPGLSGTGN